MAGDAWCATVTLVFEGSGRDHAFWCGYCLGERSIRASRQLSNREVCELALELRWRLIRGYWVCPLCMSYLHWLVEVQP